jgi:hypothetical protein
MKLQNQFATEDTEGTEVKRVLPGFFSVISVPSVAE